MTTRAPASSNGSAPPLCVRGLIRRYGRFTAVDQLDLDVMPGEILGFLGPNGAGKTTTLRCCAGLLRPDAGTVEIAGHSLRRDAMRARAGFGFVPDRPFFYERLSAREFLEFVASLYEVPGPVAATRSAELMARLELEEVAEDLIETYSHGMRQKVSVAAALMHDPPLVMLDEPITGLDPRGTRVLKDLLRERTDRGLGVLVSTHLLDVAERLCDRVVILHRGVKRAEGTLDELRGDRTSATLEEVFLALTNQAEPER